MKKFFGFIVASVLLLAGPVAVFAQEQDPDAIADTLERSKAKKKLLGCADPYSWPYSQQSYSDPGFDVRILDAIAKEGGMEIEMVWADTGTRGGTGRAFRNSILRKRCDVFVGLSDNGEEDFLPDELVFSKPYMSLGYVMMVQGPAEGIKSLEDAKKGNVKVGVPMSTPIDDYLFMNQVPRELYLNNRRLMQGMSKGEVNAAMVWSPAIAVAKKEFPEGKFHLVQGYVPKPEHRTNSSFVVRRDDKALLEFLNQSIGKLVSAGKIKPIVESYGMPFFDVVSR
ncbi:MAG: substrate-binding periplasmic protein [Burkholderiales bacterium]